MSLNKGEDTMSQACSDLSKLLEIFFLPYKIQIDGIEYFPNPFIVPEDMIEQTQQNPLGEEFHGFSED